MLLLLIYTYFALGKERTRYRRAPQIPGPTVQEQLLDHVDDQADGQHAYTLVKERKQPRSTPQKRGKQVGKRADSRGVGRRMIIDIHLEVLDECQKERLHLTKEDFFESLVQEFMGSKFMEEEENVPMVDVPKEQVPSSEFGV
ncbi:SICA antigen [Plasmodium coatneyi]|uniref:SICA antigen n=1 Tax=Plasmodium coatneyi TaxID=208452 RepID=A0A1B1DXT6_9APIC|nr:SICA antigen [Plasmodium coatneyi]ANQ07593.1 SICA antigen [Plasmodium coatneyi]